MDAVAFVYDECFAQQSKMQYLNDHPRSRPIFFVVAGPLIHDVSPVLIPDRLLFIVQSQSAFWKGRECAESSSSREIQNDYLFP